MAEIQRILATTDAFTSAEALKALRKALGETQQQFANRVGMAVATIARYETSRPPRGQAILRFANLAEENGFFDIATAFNNAIIRDLGLAARTGFVEAGSRIERLNTILSEGETIEGARLEEARRLAWEAVQLIRSKNPFAPTVEE